MVKICATTVLAILCVAASLYAWNSGDPDQFVRDYGYSTVNMLSGNFYVLLTSIFLHSDFSHLISNIFVLTIFGLTLEGEIGCRRFLLLFFGGAFFGDLLSSLIYNPAVPAIGASGGVFAIIAATMLIKPIPTDYYFPMPLGVIAIGYLIYALAGLITNYPPNVSHIAHLGGALVGLIYGCQRQGLKKTLQILMVVTVILLAVPIIWNFWSILLGLITGSISLS
ncbi:MAG: rhomboid family intramembrane serine protease [Candidatus Aenigmarchaeota archaeon]|nr:rhomboid family intramembrane serine protease [Candidatus Aenigmarchaeota archaeon]